MCPEYAVHRPVTTRVLTCHCSTFSPHPPCDCVVGLFSVRSRRDDRLEEEEEEEDFTSGWEISDRIRLVMKIFAINEK